MANRELVTYVLFLLGGDSKRIHTEDIALKCFELFPDSFSWVKYPNYPDKDIVRVALTDARKKQFGALVEGRAGQVRSKLGSSSNSDGWMLTNEGAQWVRRNLSRLEDISETKLLKEHRQKVLKKIKRIRDHLIYAQYSDNPERFYPMIGDIAEILRCRVDAEPEIWSERFERLRREGEAAGQSDIVDFVNKCETAYQSQR